MRARILKPGFFSNERLARLPVRARLLFAGLWCLADREGRLEDRPARIKAAIFPYERVRVMSLLKTLKVAGFVKSYHSVAGPALLVATFGNHQHPHPNEPESKLKPRSENVTRARDISRTAPVDLDLRSGTQDQDQELTASRASLIPPFKVFAAIATRVVRAHQTADMGELAELVKTACAEQAIAYDSSIVTRAIQAALAAQARRHA